MSPHFVLISESRISNPEQSDLSGPDQTAAPRYWHFVLRREDGQVAEDAWDEESGASEERLALLAVVRGLEAIPRPARVTLVTQHAWIRRGMRFGLDAWRDNHWRWERFGAMAPIKHGDLWRRIDRAMQYHDVQCSGPLGSASRDDLSSPASQVSTPHPAEERPILTPNRTSRPVPAAANLRIAHDTRTGATDLLRRLFGWCRLCRPDTSLLMAAR